MSNIAQTKASLLETIHSLEDKKESLSAAIESLKAAVRTIDELSPDDLPGPSTPSGPSDLFENEDGNRYSRLAESAIREGTQFNRLAMLFVERRNAHLTVAELAEAISASRSATTNILYRTQKEAFVSERVPGHVRLRAWKLHPELYRRLVLNSLEPLEPTG